MPAPRRTHPPTHSAAHAEQALILLRQIAADIAALRQAAEGEATLGLPPLNEVIDPRDLITPQQAAGIAGRDASTMRRWQRETPDLGVIVGGTPFIRKSKLLERLAATKSRVDRG